MNKNIKTILATAAIALTTGYVTAGTWVNGYYIDGPLCTVCDGMRVINHAYGTTTCTHCDGTGIEPPEETVVVQNVVLDTWCAPPPPPHHRPIVHRHHAPTPPPRHHRAASARPAPRAPQARNVNHRQAPPARPAGSGHGGGHHARR